MPVRTIIRAHLLAIALVPPIAALSPTGAQGPDSRNPGAQPTQPVAPPSPSPRPAGADRSAEPHLAVDPPLLNPRPTGVIVPLTATARENHERAIREALERLPAEKRHQVLEAMKKVWADDDVRAAREELRRATESYRRTLRAAMEETDPDVRTAVRPLLDRLLRAGLTPEAWSEPSDATTPEPSTPADGPPRYLRLLGLLGDRAASLTPEDRQLLSSVRDRIMNDERVTRAAAALAATRNDNLPRARAQAMQELRRVTRAVAIEIEPRLQPLLNHDSPKPEAP